jgi:hypothetical protein
MQSKSRLARKGANAGYKRRQGRLQMAPRQARKHSKAGYKRRKGRLEMVQRQASYKTKRLPRVTKVRGYTRAQL